MTRAMRWLPVLLAVSFLVAAGCGDDDDDSSGEQATTQASYGSSCIDSWNAEANADYQTVLAGIISASGADPSKIRVGTWPESERSVNYRSAKDAFGSASGKATVPSGACLVVLPSSQAGEETFFEDQDTWYMTATADKGEKFPLAAKSSIADPDTATADALGKLTLN